jgi:transposase
VGCHVAAFKAFGGTARAIPYGHMKTAETGEGDRDGSV